MNISLFLVLLCIGITVCQVIDSLFRLFGIYDVAVNKLQYAELIAILDEVDKNIDKVKITKLPNDLKVGGSLYLDRTAIIELPRG